MLDHNYNLDVDIYEDNDDKYNIDNNDIQEFNISITKNEDPIDLTMKTTLVITNNYRVKKLRKSVRHLRTCQIRRSSCFIIEVPGL